VIPYGTGVPVAVRLLANCYTPFTLPITTVLIIKKATVSKSQNVKESSHPNKYVEKLK